MVRIQAALTRSPLSRAQRRYNHRVVVVWSALGLGVAFVGGLIGYVAWRDRRRQLSTEESSAGRQARANADRYEVERHAGQSHQTTRGQVHGP
jgi:hypothetical protein